jgi:hypothetical protein
MLSLGALCSAVAEDLWNSGFLFDEFRLTLDAGQRTEALGPLFNADRREESASWALPPFCSAGQNPGLDTADFDFLYPLVTYNRFGSEYRFHILQLFSFAGGKSQKDEEARRFTLFPFYFQQRSADPEKNYTALWPIYGHLEGRLFRSEVDFVLWPIYSKTQRHKTHSPLPDDAFLAGRYRNLNARRGNITTYNYVYPFFHLRYGDGLEGWQFLPFYGTEHKSVTTRTNGFGDVEMVPGHEKKFIAWPFYFNQTMGIGSQNPEHVQTWLPFYTVTRSPLRDSTSYGWPIGVTVTEDRGRGYREVDAPWPLVVFAQGEGKTTRRVWPFFSHAANTNLQSDFFLWPIYKYNRFQSAPLDRDRTRILLFLYSHVNERNTVTGTVRQRTDLWPFYTHKKDRNGDTRLQVLSPLEPFLPTTPSIERNYSPVWSIWRAERNAKTSAVSQSLLWNLYRRETMPEAKKWSFLFGLFQSESDSQGRRGRLFYIPVGRRVSQSGTPASATAGLAIESPGAGSELVAPTRSPAE